MKCKIPPMSNKQRKELKLQLYSEIQEYVDTRLKDREMQAGCRAQWMLLVACIRRYGFGKKRLLGIFEEMDKMLPELIQDREADAMDECLIRALEVAGLDVKLLFREYFEASEREKQFNLEVEKMRKEREH